MACILHKSPVLKVGHWILADLIVRQIHFALWRLGVPPPLVTTVLLPRRIHVLFRRAHQELAGRDAHHLRFEDLPLHLLGGRLRGSAAGQVDVGSQFLRRQVNKVGFLGPRTLGRVQGQQAAQGGAAGERGQRRRHGWGLGLLSLNLGLHNRSGPLHGSLLLGPEVGLQLAQVAGHLAQQLVEVGVAVLDDHHLGQAHRLDGLGQLLAGQLPHQQKDVDRALDLAGVGGQAQGKDVGAAGIRKMGHQVSHKVAHVGGVNGRQQEGQLDDLFQVLAALDLALVAGLDGLLHGLVVYAQQKDAAGHVQEELDGFQDLDGLLRQAAVQVVHKDDQPPLVADHVSVQQVPELALELLQGAQLLTAVALHLTAEGLGHGLLVLAGDGLGRALEQVDQRQPARHKGQGDLGRSLGRAPQGLGPVQGPPPQFLPLHGAVQALFQAVQVVHHGPLLLAQLFFGVERAVLLARPQGVQDAQDQGPPQGLLFVVFPGVEPDRAVAGQPAFVNVSLDHAHQAGLARAPGAENADGQRGVGVGASHDLHQGVAVGRKAQGVHLSRAVVQDR